MIEYRSAVTKDAIVLARLLETSLRQGIEGRFKIDRRKLLDHVGQVILSSNGFAHVAVNDNKVIGCFCAELSPHAYCRGYVINELGVYIDSDNRGGRTFIKLFLAFLKWAESKPDVLMTGFTIGQLNATTPYMRRVLNNNGFTKGSEGYYKL